MRKYLHFLGIHLKKDTQQIEIPARPFLGTLLNKDVKEYIYNAAELDGDDLKLDTLLAEQRSETNGGFMEDLANIVGAKALEMVQTAFSTGGYPDKWQPITEVTKKHRLGDPNNPPLTDTGDLRNSVTVEIKKVK
jgi:phage gpG-like protein